MQMILGHKDPSTFLEYYFNNHVSVLLQSAMCGREPGDDVTEILRGIEARRTSGPGSNVSEAQLKLTPLYVTALAHRDNLVS